jgi:hypothetical protein
VTGVATGAASTLACAAFLRACKLAAGAGASVAVKSKADESTSAVGFFYASSISLSALAFNDPWTAVGVWVTSVTISFVWIAVLDPGGLLSTNICCLVEAARA